MIMIILLIGILAAFIVMVMERRYQVRAYKEEQVANARYNAKLLEEIKHLYKQLNDFKILHRRMDDIMTSVDEMIPCEGIVLSKYEETDACACFGIKTTKTINYEHDYVRVVTIEERAVNEEEKNKKEIYYSNDIEQIDNYFKEAVRRTRRPSPQEPRETY